jgi:mono/diheme cytochrome c family protein
MKKTIGTLAGVVILSMGVQVQVCATEQTDVGKKIYDRAFGRGCGTCHDIKTNPQLTENIKAGTLNRAQFEEVITNGRGGMPKALDEIMKISEKAKSGYGKEQALDALFEYIKSK